MQDSKQLLKPEEVIPKGLYTFHPGLASRGSGARLFSSDGREFLDLTSGLGVMILGYGEKRLLEAIETQARKLVHQCAHVMMHEAYLELATSLCRLAPFEGAKVFLCNSGAEAVEWAVKVARLATGRTAVVAFDGGYHGRTLLAASLTSRAKPYRKGYGSMAPEVYHVPYPYCYRCAWGKKQESCSLECLGGLERFFFLERPPEEVAAVVVEPIQGEGGVVVPPEGFLQALSALCSKHGILLVADEVQTGLGRTGRLFCVQHQNLNPDLLVLGKALGGGLPLAALVGKAQLMDRVPASGFGSTFGGNPLACAAACCVLQLLVEEEMPQRALRLEAFFRKRAQAWMDEMPSLGQVRASGAMWGLELIKGKQQPEPAPKLAREVVRKCREKGLLLLSGGLYRNVLRLLPPLNISEQDLEKCFGVLEEVMRELSNERDAS
jgi:4-aminobutyrate aminotransferase/(S)-3-amino-2-methylpropionate transaminase